MASTSSSVVLARPQRPLVTRILRYRTMAQTKRCLWGFFFASPWLLGLLIFTIGPIIASLFLSLTQYDVITTPKFLGIQNYTRAFLEDDLFWPSLGRTFKYALVVVPLGVVGSLGLAMLLNRGYLGTNLFRTLYFLPSLTPSVAMAVLWKWLLHPSVGPVNNVLGLVGIKGPGWLSSTAWALPSVMMISLWAGLGGNRMLIFLAGLQGVPDELYDAADVDGANTWQRFFHVTLPMISPTLFFNTIMSIIGALKVFSLAYVATQGGPSWATWFYALHLYRVSFQYFEMGYGSALAWIFAAILITLTMIQFNLSNRWVYYAGGN